MKDNTDKSGQVRFILKVALLAIGIAEVAYLASSQYDLRIGVVLLISGALVGGIGAVLAAPSSFDPANPNNRGWNYNRRPNEFVADAEAYEREHTAPRRGFEFVLTNAGVAVLMLGVVLLVLGK